MAWGRFFQAWRKGRAAAPPDASCQDPGLYGDLNIAVLLESWGGVNTRYEDQFLFVGRCTRVAGVSFACQVE